MPAHLKRTRPSMVLPCLIVCASCAALPQVCVQCSLSCDGAQNLEKHERVIVSASSLLQKLPEKVFNVSSLLKERRCSVPDCFLRDTEYTLEIYSEEGQVSAALFISTSKPDCGAEGIPVKKNRDGADGKLSDVILIWLAFCFWIVFP